MGTMIPTRSTSLLCLIFCKVILYNSINNYTIGNIFSGANLDDLNDLIDNDEDSDEEDELETVSYTHLTLPTKA